MSTKKQAPKVIETKNTEIFDKVSDLTKLVSIGLNADHDTPSFFKEAIDYSAYQRFDLQSNMEILKNAFKLMGSMLENMEAQYSKVSNFDEYLKNNHSDFRDNL